MEREADYYTFEKYNEYGSDYLYDVEEVYEERRKIFYGRTNKLCSYLCHPYCDSCYRYGPIKVY